MIAKSYVYVVQVAMGTSQVQYFCRRLRTPLNKSDEMSNVIKEAEVGQPAPEFKQYDFMLRATIRKVALQGDSQKTTQKDSEKTTQKTTQKIIEAIMGNPNISIEELAVVCGLTRDGINYNIRNLKKRGVIRRVGPDKGGHWEVIKDEI
ncbi:MAG: winged helix-turn-helix transcriptional regulator [Bacteroidales bacterium]|nr:winged helix-turn-helix transcriptional regulator [Bacteroidales bacterium]